MAGIVIRIVFGAVLMGLTTSELKGELKNAQYDAKKGVLTYEDGKGLTHKITKFKMMKSSQAPSANKIIVMRHNQSGQTVQIAYVSKETFWQM